jgi:hypothetical protein
MQAKVPFVAVFACAATVFAASPNAHADATISIGNDYARPPVTVVRDDTPPMIFEEAPPRELPKDPYRAPFRLTIGPAAVTSGQGVGPGLFAAADFGSGTVGVRLSAAWFRGEAPDDPSARLGTSLGLYSGELVLDLHKGGPLHPIVALGLGGVNIGTALGTNGWAIAGLGRVGVEYALALEDADVRFGVGLTGALLGPSDQAIENARAFAMMNATFSIGF